MKKGRVVIAILCSLTLIGIGFLAGVRTSYLGNARSVINADAQRLWEVWRHVKAEHIDGANISDEELLNGAIHGLTQTTKDPYTSYIDKKEVDHFKEATGSKSFCGIGIELQTTNDTFIVAVVVKNSPADMAGIKKRDVIVKITSQTKDGQKTLMAGDADWNLNNIVSLVRGEAGTEVILTILRKGSDQPQDITITRAIVQTPTLDVKTLDDVIYLKLYHFSEKSAEKFKSAILSQLRSDTKAIIIDLRDNGGGLLNECSDIAKLFLLRDMKVCSQEFRKGFIDDVADDDGFLSHIPIIVLVNGRSASASEILAAALHDNHRAMLVGEKTFGKGIGQSIITLKDESLLKLTTFQWITPLGVKIHKKGIQPDIEVKRSDEDIENGKDPQLDKALEILKSQSH